MLRNKPDVEGAFYSYNSKLSIFFSNVKISALPTAWASLTIFLLGPLSGAKSFVKNEISFKESAAKFYLLSWKKVYL